MFYFQSITARIHRQNQYALDTNRINEFGTQVRFKLDFQRKIIKLFIQRLNRIRVFLVQVPPYIIRLRRGCSPKFVHPDTCRMTVSVCLTNRTCEDTSKPNQPDLTYNDPTHNDPSIRSLIP